MKKFLEKATRLAVWTAIAWALIGTALVGLLALEGGLGLIFHLNGNLSKQADSQAENDDYFDELKRASVFKWYPYIYMRHQPFKGKYLTIENGGIRRTWNNGGNKKSDGLKIAMFGGSVLWGYGARDDFTIPSVLSRLLAESGISANVTNHADSGYTSTQELVYLLLQIQKGDIPDIAVFYDGITDAASASVNRKAGVTFNEYNRVKEFNLTNETRKKDLYKTSMESLWENSNIYKAMQIINPEKPPGPPYKINSPHANRLAEEVVKTYISNVKIIENLGKAYRFKTLFIWQPIVFTKSKLAPEEKRIVDNTPFRRYFHLKTNEILGKSEFLKSNPNFHDFSGVFGEDESQHYFDYTHITERGNEIVAAELFKSVSKAVDELKNGAKKISGFNETGVLP